MKLPSVRYGGVESLGRYNVAAEMAEATRKIDAAADITQMAYESYDHYQLLKDQENALTEANRTTQVNSVLRQLETPDVNLSTLPQEVISAYRNSDNYDKSKHGVTPDGAEFAPSHLLMQSAYDYANKELGASNDRLRSPRAQDIYRETVGKDIDNAFEIAATGVRTSQINALTLQTNDAINSANATGSIHKALGLAENAYRSGLYTPAEYDKQKNDIYRYKAKLYEEDQTQLQQWIYNAEFNGRQEESQALKNQALEHAKIVGEFDGLVVSPDQQAEFDRQFNLSGYKGEVDGKAHILATESSADESVAYVEKQIEKLTLGDRSDLPDGVGIDDALRALGTSRSNALARKNALASATKDLKGSAKRRSQLVNIEETLALHNGVLPSTGGAYKDYSELFQQGRAELIRNGADWRQLSDYNISLMRRYKQMPKGLKQAFDGVDRQTPEKQLQIAREYAHLRAMHPELARLYDGKNVGYLNEAARMNIFGDDESNSEAMIDQLNNRFVMEPEVYNRNLKNARDGGILSNKKLREVSDGIFEEAFGRSALLFWEDDPAMGTRVQMEIERVYQHEIGKGADPDAAYDTALAMVDNKVGIDYTNPNYPDGVGRILPPNKAYGDPDNLWVGAQAEKLKADVFPDYPAEGIYFEADGLTLTQENPSYKVMFKDPANPNATPYQLTSWDKGGQPRGVITGMSGARWRPDPQDTEQFRQAQTAQANELLSGQTMNQLQDEYYATAVGILDEMGIDANTDSAQVRVAVKDIQNAYDSAITSLKSDPRFYSRETVTDRRGNRSQKSILDEERFDQAKAKIKAAHERALKEVQARSGRQAASSLNTQANRRRRADRTPVQVETQKKSRAEARTGRVRM